MIVFIYSIALQTVLSRSVLSRVSGLIAGVVFRTESVGIVHIRLDVVDDFLNLGAENGCVALVEQYGRLSVRRDVNITNLAQLVDNAHLYVDGNNFRKQQVFKIYADCAFADDNPPLGNGVFDIFQLHFRFDDICNTDPDGSKMNQKERD